MAFPLRGQSLQVLALLLSALLYFVAAKRLARDWFRG